MSEFSIIRKKIFKTVLLYSCVARAMAQSAPKLQEIKTFMVELGLCQVWASKRELAQ